MVDEHWVDDAMYDMSIIALLTENTWHGTVDDNFSWFVVYIHWLLWNLTLMRITHCIICYYVQQHSTSIVTTDTVYNTLTNYIVSHTFRFHSNPPM